jgi:hypothetical protein
MRQHLVILIALAACGRSPERVDSTDAALPAIDTLKPVAASDTLLTVTDTPATAGRSAAPAKTTGAVGGPGAKSGMKLGRDSAFPPPRGLPKLDTVPTKRPPR